MKRLAYELRPAAASATDDQASSPAPAACCGAGDLPARARTPPPAGVDAQTMARQVESLLSKSAGPTRVTGSRAIRSQAVVDFVCEEDVRQAIRLGRTITVGDRTIITPAARDLAAAPQGIGQRGLAAGLTMVLPFCSAMSVMLTAALEHDAGAPVPRRSSRSSPSRCSGCAAAVAPVATPAPPPAPSPSPVPVVVHDRSTGPRAAGARSPWDRRSRGRSRNSRPAAPISIARAWWRRASTSTAPSKSCSCNQAARGRIRACRPRLNGCRSHCGARRAGPARCRRHHRGAVGAGRHRRGAERGHVRSARAQSHHRRDRGRGPRTAAARRADPAECQGALLRRAVPGPAARLHAGRPWTAASATCR